MNLLILERGPVSSFSLNVEEQEEMQRNDPQRGVHQSNVTMFRENHLDSVGGILLTNTT